MKPFQRWLMAFLGISCLVLSVYSYSIHQNLQVIEQRRQAQTSLTGQSLWLGWNDCADRLEWVLRAVDEQNLADVLTYLSNAQIFCQSSSKLLSSYMAALDFPVKPWWNFGQLTESNSIGLVMLFPHYSIQINEIKYAIKTEGLVSPANRARIQQLHDDISQFAQQVSESILEKGDIAEIHAAIATWCGMVTDIDAKKTIILPADQYRGVCK